MKSEYRFLFAKLFAIIAAGLVFGCSPPAPTGKTADRSLALKTASGAAATATSGDYNCPTDYNVLLKDHIGLGGWDFSGAESFKVCYSRASNAAFKITGTTASKAVCLYPMHSGASGAPTLVSTPQCFNISGSPITPTFASPTAIINYMVIVDVNYTNALNACLSDTTPCPPHSEGFVQ